MALIHLVTAAALVEFFIFAWLVGRARVRYGVKAPATTGNETFERWFRVQQNTLELLIIFVPALWIAAAYWDHRVIAALGVVYIIGRVVYLRGYVRAAAARHGGFLLSIVPVAILLVAAIVGALLALLPPR